MIAKDSTTLQYASLCHRCKKKFEIKI